MNVEEIRQIAVVGAGLMGHGIAQEFALAGYEVYLNDLTEEKLQDALHSIRSNLEMFVKVGLASPEQAESVPARIHTGTVLTEVVSDVDLVIEAVLENLELKKEIFRALDEACPERTILASNTSSLMPSQFACATHRPDKVLVTHYFNPPHLLPLVEIVPSKETSEETVTVIHDLMTKVGKRPVLVQKEVPGFIGNRLQMALFREALSIVEKGIATPQDVDTVIKNSFGRRLSVAGPFEVYALPGWDLIHAVYQYLISDIDSSIEIPSILREKVERGELGVKSGKGFRDWTPETAEALRQRIAHALVNIAQWPGSKVEE